jgi:drug/metabolite transporter (DMT)-like permease
MLGILLSYLGVLAIVAPWSLDSTNQLSIAGVVLALFSTLIWASYWLLNARTADPVTTMAVGFGTATAILIAACYWLETAPFVSTVGLLYALWIGLVEMGFAFLLWQAALRRTKRAALLGQLIFLSPFVSLWLIQNVLGEPVRLSSIIGLAIIVAGLIWGGRPAGNLSRLT